ncbi:TIR domain-containing protein [Saccharothrix ecbatanensis]|uniref:TIR domain-containing protein n=1 Tax=Saccharothrix ecbatanensis TaxID=1105145 RepID=UPI001FE84C78|nr:TIR domain-containing protein [Saccharothrix ecbatanensis]
MGARYRFRGGIGSLATTNDDSSDSYDVFVSYASADRDVVAPFVELLKREGLKVWFYDQDMHGGPALKKQIADAIKRSKHTIACLTDSYVTRPWTKFELALSTHRDPAGDTASTILVRFKPMTGPVPEDVQHLTVSDLTDQRNYDRTYERITKLIKRPVVVDQAHLEELCQVPFQSAEPHVTLYRIRRANEALSTFLYRREIGELPPDATLNLIIGQLIVSGKLPREIMAALAIMQSLGNIVVSDRIDDSPITSASLVTPLAAWRELSAWTFPEFKAPDVLADVCELLPLTAAGRRIPDTDYVITGDAVSRNSHGPLHPGHDTVRDRPVSINLVGVAADHDDAFFAEVARFTRLSDANIVSPTDAGTVVVDGERRCLFLVLPVVDGGSAQAITEHHGTLPPRAAYELCLGIARALCGFHAAEPPIAHGDLRPANVIVGTFGTVRVLCIGSEADVAEGRLDSFLFASPQQRVGAPLTPTSDVAALRLVLHYLLTGEYLAEDGPPLGPGVDPGGVLDKLAECATAARACAILEAARTRLPAAPNLASVYRDYMRKKGIAAQTRPPVEPGVVLVGSYPVDARRAWPLGEGLVLVWESGTDTLAILDDIDVVWRDTGAIAVRRVDIGRGRIAVGGWDGAVRYFADGALVASGKLDGAVGDLRLIGDDVVAGSWKHSLWRFSHDGTRDELLDVEAGVHRIAVANHGERFAVADLAGGLSIYAGRRRVSHMPGIAMAADVAYAGSRLVVLTDDALISMGVDGAIGLPERKPGGVRLRPGASAGDCTLVVASGPPRSVEVWRVDEADRQLRIATFPPGTDVLATVGDCHLVSTPDDGYAYWRQGTERLHWPDAVSGALSADGSWVAVCRPGKVELYQDVG